MFKHYEVWETIKKENHFYVRKSDNKVYIMKDSEPDKLKDIEVTQNLIEKMVLKIDGTALRVQRWEVFYLYDLYKDEFDVVNDIVTDGDSHAN